MWPGWPGPPLPHSLPPAPPPLRTHFPSQVSPVLAAGVQGTPQHPSLHPCPAPRPPPLHNRLLHVLRLSSYRIAGQQSGLGDHCPAKSRAWGNSDLSLSALCGKILRQCWFCRWAGSTQAGPRQGWTLHPENPRPPGQCPAPLKAPPANPAPSPCPGPDCGIPTPSIYPLQDSLLGSHRLGGRQWDCADLMASGQRRPPGPSAPAARCVCSLILGHPFSRAWAAFIPRAFCGSNRG